MTPGFTHFFRKIFYWKSGTANFFAFRMYACFWKWHSWQLGNLTNQQYAIPCLSWKECRHNLWFTQSFIQWTTLFMIECSFLPNLGLLLLCLLFCSLCLVLVIWRQNENQKVCLIILIVVGCLQTEWERRLKHENRLFWLHQRNMEPQTRCRLSGRRW